jgi:hypothetical protein
VVMVKKKVAAKIEKRCNRNFQFYRLKLNGSRIGSKKEKMRFAALKFSTLIFLLKIIMLERCPLP